MPSSVTMLSTEVTTYTSDPSFQDREDSEASTLLIPLQDGDSPPYQDAVAPFGWSLNCKAMVVISVGLLLFGSGTALSLLFFTQVGNVPYLLGPLFLSMGLMFLVTGLVWMSILRSSLQHRSLTTVNQVEWRSRAQTTLMDNSGPQTIKTESE